MIAQTMVLMGAKFFISRLKIRGAMAVSVVAMASATLFLFLDVVFEGIEERILVYIFSDSLKDSFCSLCLFCDEQRNSNIFFQRKQE